jgi:uncharacterized protein YdeI (YjbR/CyaY-like superfamily)
VIIGYLRREIWPRSPLPDVLILFMAEHKGLSIQAFSTRAARQTWLVRHGSTSRGLWLKIAKQASGIKSVSKSEAIQVALAHGWIDGQLDRLDERYWLTRFTPRGPRSIEKSQQSS